MGKNTMIKGKNLKQQLQCELCSYVTKWGNLRTVRRSLTYHIIEHHKEKEHKCDKCNKTFSFLYQKRRHMCKDVDIELYCNEEHKENEKRREILQEERTEDKPADKIELVI